LHTGVETPTPSIRVATRVVPPHATQDDERLNDRGGRPVS